MSTILLLRFSHIFFSALIMRNALVIGFLILCISSSNFSIGRGLTIFNVLDYGALGDGKTDDSKVKFSSVYARLCAYMYLFS